jgi:hypothetical protein
VRTHLFVLGLAALLCVPSPAAAQRRMPHTGASGLGVEFGTFNPQQDGMSAGLDVAGFFEHYMSPRDSVRLDVDWANPKVGDSTDHSTREVRIGGELIHNWEGGSIHPFVGAGLGVYFLQARVAGNNVGDGATKLGGTALGGAEFFATKTVSVKAEVRYNIVPKWNAYNPSGLAFTIGLKSYF